MCLLSNRINIRPCAKTNDNNNGLSIKIKDNRNGPRAKTNFFNIMTIGLKFNYQITELL